MYQYSLKTSLQNRKKRLKEQEKMQDQKKVKKKELFSIIKFWIKMVWYLIYPKKKDFQKVFLLVVGALSGLFLQKISFFRFLNCFLAIYLKLHFYPIQQMVLVSVKM